MKRQEQLQKMKKEWKKSKPKITFDEETDGKKKIAITIDCDYFLFLQMATSSV